jgi:hypothetical protein
MTEADIQIIVGQLVAAFGIGFGLGVFTLALKKAFQGH